VIFTPLHRDFRTALTNDAGQQCVVSSCWVSLAAS